MHFGQEKAVLIKVPEPSQCAEHAPDFGAAITVRLAHAADADCWNEFVSSRPLATLGHLFEWKQVFESAYRKTTKYLIAFSDGRVAGVLPFVHMGGLLGGNCLVSLPFLDQAGVLASTSAAREALWTHALRLAGEMGVKSIALRAPSCEGAGGSGRATLVLRLPPSGDDLWRSFSTKVRNQVRKSEKEGLRTEAVGGDLLGAFYRVFSRNMRDLGSPVHARGFLEAVLEAFGPRASLYVTTDGTGRVIGGALALRAGGVVTVPWASSLRESFASCPNHSLYWKILSHAVGSGAEAFDFGRSHEDSGTFRFKRQWGAEPRPLTWTSFDANGRLSADTVLNPNEHAILTRLWRALPVTLATFVGPLLRRQLSN
jgi:FemAB-related protein (PEP-CTERM system-associated)